MSVSCRIDSEHGLARMFQSMSPGSSVDTDIFRTMEDARGWVHASADDGRRPRDQGPL